jgi:hypothetical protein
MSTNLQRGCQGKPGSWKGKYGSRAAWIPFVTGAGERNGYRLDIKRGKPYLWAEASSDPRALEPEASSKSGQRKSASWFADPSVKLSITPAGPGLYRLSVYLLDFDLNGRVLLAAISDETGPLDARRSTREEAAGGIYLTWTVSGAVDLEVRKIEGFNAVVSGVFVDPVGD